MFAGMKNFFKGLANTKAAKKIKSGAKSVASKIDIPAFANKVVDTGKDFFSDIGSTISTVWDRVLNGETNVRNAEIAKQTNEINERIAKENLEYQKQNLEYQKSLQEQLFQREDSAYTRTAADMRSAGLNPLAMNGTNGAGEAIATSPLNNDFQAQGYNYQSMSPLEAINSIIGFGSALETIKSQKLQNEAQELSNRYNRDTYNDRVNSQSYETMMKQTESLLKSYDEANAYQKRIYNQMFGIVDGMDHEERQAAIINTILGDDDELREALELSGNQHTNRKNKRYAKTYGAVAGGKAIKSVLQAILP